MFNSGWYDVIVLPVHDCKWTFKEGDVAVLAYPRPSAGLSLSLYDVLFFLSSNRHAMSTLPVKLGL